MKIELNHRRVNFTSRDCVIVQSHKFVNNYESNSKMLATNNNLMSNSILKSRLSGRVFLLKIVYELIGHEIVSTFDSITIEIIEDTD